MQGDMHDDDSDEEYEATLDRLCAKWEQGVRNQAREQGTRSSIVHLYEVRFGSVSEDLRAALTRIRGEDALRRIWIVTGTRAAEDAIAAVREVELMQRLPASDSGRDLNRGARYRVRKGPAIR